MAAAHWSPTGDGNPQVVTGDDCQEMDPVGDGSRVDINPVWI